MGSPAKDWYRRCYTDTFAKWTLDTEPMHQQAKAQVDFLMRQMHLRPGQAILDVPCGTGRHAQEFAKRGLVVTGLDISPDCLRRAQKNCAGLQVTLGRADMSRLFRYRGRFDATVNLFTSFGYFPTDAANARVMWELVSTLRPGGRIVLNMMNRDYLEKNFKPVSWQDEGDLFHLEARRYDPATKTNESRQVVIDRGTGRGEMRPFRVRLYSKKEMVALMKKCSLRRIRVSGDFQGNPFKRFSSVRPVYLAEKPGKPRNK